MKIELLSFYPQMRRLLLFSSVLLIIIIIPITTILFYFIFCYSLFYDDEIKFGVNFMLRDGRLTVVGTTVGVRSTVICEAVIGSGLGLTRSTRTLI